MRLISLITAAILSISVAANDFDPLSASIEQNIAYPAVSAKTSPKLVAAMHSEGDKLAGQHFNVTYQRNGEVMVVTIPASQLFRPNAETLSAGADATLRTLLPAVRRFEDFKVLVAVHSDDTGDDTYSDALTAARANAIDEYFFNHLGQQGSEHIIPYGLGRDEALAGNNSMAGRAKNRRVEFYFVPTREFIAHAKRH